MSTITLYANQSARISSDDLLFNNHTETESIASDPFCAITDFNIPGSIRKKNLVQATLYINAKGTIYTDQYGSYIPSALEAVTLQESFEETNVNYNTRPSWTRGWGFQNFADLGTAYDWRSSTLQDAKGVKESLEYGIKISIDSFMGSGYAKNSRNANKPYMVLSYDDPTVYLSNCKPINGVINKHAINTFSWALSTSAVTIEPICQVSAKFRWRPNASANYTEIDIPNTNMSYAMPGETITTNSFQWQVEVTTDSGSAVTSGWYTVSTNPIVSVKSCFPSQGFVNELSDISFSWSIKTEYSISPPVAQTSAKFRWRPDANAQYSEAAISGSAMNYTMSANTVSTSNFQWQVELTPDSGDVATSDWYTLTTVDYLPTCTNVSPVDAYVDGATPITFKWDRSIDSGTAQTRYDLQYSTDSGATWVDLKTENIAALQSTIAADVLPAGQMTWRVRSYNSDSAAGSWSTPTAIIVQSAPAAPSISGATNAARPTVSWQAVGQQSYQVQVLYGGAVICDTGEVGSAKKTHKVTDYLANGSYAVRVRIKNVYGLFSEWAEYGFTISVAALSAPTFTAAAVAGGALVTVSSPDDYAAVYVLRDGVPVAKLTGSAWTDRHSVGEHSYTVRGIDASDNYADGTAVSVTVSVPVPEVAPADDYTGVVKMPYTSGGLRIVNKTVLPETATYYAAGRAMPVVEFGEHESVTHSFTVSYRTRVEAERLVALIGQALAYRNAECCYFAALTSFNYSAQAGCWDCGVQLTEISYVDAVEYD